MYWSFEDNSLPCVPLEDDTVTSFMLQGMKYLKSNLLGIENDMKQYEAIKRSCCD